MSTYYKPFIDTWVDVGVIMTPRAWAESIDLEAVASSHRVMIECARHSHYPLISGNKVLGCIRLQDLERVALEVGKAPWDVIHECRREIFRVVHSESAQTLLGALYNRGDYMAAVTLESGEFAGVVTSVDAANALVKTEATSIEFQEPCSPAYSVYEIATRLRVLHSLLRQHDRDALSCLMTILPTPNVARLLDLLSTRYQERFWSLLE